MKSFKAENGLEFVFELRTQRLSKRWLDGDWLPSTNGPTRLKVAVWAAPVCLVPSGEMSWIRTSFCCLQI